MPLFVSTIFLATLTNDELPRQARDRRKGELKQKEGVRFVRFTLQETRITATPITWVR
jgi:hypothetical protein